MRFVPGLLAGLVALCCIPVSAEKLLQANYVTSCSDDDLIQTDKITVNVLPAEKKVWLEYDGHLGYDGKVMFNVDLFAYGYNITRYSLDPCDLKIANLCPMAKGKMPVPWSPMTLSDSALDIIPTIAYYVPDLDCLVRVSVVKYGTDELVSCIEAPVTNNYSVYVSGVGWAIGVIVGLGLLTSVVLSILGYSNIATHVSFRTMLLLGFLQSQAMYGMLAMDFRPLARNWTQDFQWTVGVVHAEFLQTIATWFQRATGGTPSDVMTQEESVSVALLKRSANIVKRKLPDVGGGEEILLKGIERMGYRSDIEPTNIFMTSYLVFYFVMILMMITLVIIKFALPAISKKANSAKLNNALSGGTEWKGYMRGNIYRLAMLSYPQFCSLGLWELYHRDSAAEIILAIVMFLTTSAALGFATFKVFQRARASRALNENPTYTLYSDPACLTKWGFLYVHYKAQCYYFIAPMLAYILIKGVIVAFVQESATAQAVLILVLEAAFLIATSVIRPYMDKKANSFSIAASAINFVSGICMLIFSNVFNQPNIVSGVVTIIFFFMNAIFTITLIVFLLISFFYAFRLKEPTAQYHRLSDNRDSFRMSQTDNRLNTELLPLEKAIRPSPIGDDRPASPWAQSNGSVRSRWDPSNPTPSESRWDPGHVGAGYNHHEPPRSPFADQPPRSPFADPVEPTLPLIPSSDNVGRRV
ncbi:hypothetical protein N7532_007531 [Penicillium argentinense]|uniref:ML-like domain-containing protein n=1 Tax=Penicillium argentinense TaxID=1131581 RepID=A0A9W9F7V3_9EURO|nr:uncharacterized protein N7532_007531 [Penicillium argentinense]KAJ5095240.1 hypothetical protein N7532_007531 [Penicillium argentinense]